MHTSGYYINITILNVTTSLISHNPRERMFSLQISLLVVTFPSHISWILTLKCSTKEFKPHVHMHHVVIIVIIVIIAMVLFHNVTLILYYHASMLPLHTSSYQPTVEFSSHSHHFHIADQLNRIDG